VPVKTGRKTGSALADNTAQEVQIERRPVEAHKEPALLPAAELIAQADEPSVASEHVFKLMPRARLFRNIS
jgi:hypothetical protein